MFRIIPFMAVFLLQCSHLPIDTAMSAEQGNMATGVICGGGGGCQKGMRFLQLHQGTSTSSDLRIVMPKLRCGLRSCVRLQVFNQDGTTGLTGGIPEGDTDFKFTLKDLTFKDFIDHDDDGEWLVKIKAFFLDQDDSLVSALGYAFIRINVIDPSYIKLGCDDPLYAWSVAQGTEVIQFTTAFRTAICGKQ